MTKFSSPQVAAAFDAFPEDAKGGLLRLRALIFEVAKGLPQVGKLSEDLRWGQPAYLTPQTKTGSTLRLGVPKEGGFGLYAHCQTTIISDHARAFAGLDRLDGNRGVLFGDVSDIDPDRHGMLIASALTYHQRRPAPRA